MSIDLYQTTGSSPPEMVPHLMPDLPGEIRSRHFPQEVKVAISARDGGRCRYCGSTEDPEYDHIVPWIVGGDNTVDNGQILCGYHNREKKAKTVQPGDMSSVPPAGATTKRRWKERTKPYVDPILSARNLMSKDRFVPGYALVPYGDLTAVHLGVLEAFYAGQRDRAQVQLDWVRR